MKRALLASIASVWLATQPQPVSAQVIVHDPTAYANLLQQAQTALNQLNELKSQVIEAKRLYDGFNQISDVNSLATALSTPALRAFVPQIETYVAASNGDFSGLGELGETADLIRQTHRLFSAKPGDVLGQELERIGDRAARDLALGRQAADVGSERLDGLAEITSALDTATNARAVMDIQARLAAEQAMIANDQMRLQGLAMAQAAEERLQTQRDHERSRTAADARLALYREAFQ